MWQFPISSGAMFLKFIVKLFQTLFWLFNWQGCISAFSIAVWRRSPALLEDFYCGSTHCDRHQFGQKILCPTGSRQCHLPQSSASKNNHRIAGGCAERLYLLPSIYVLHSLNDFGPVRLIVSTTAVSWRASIATSIYSADGLCVCILSRRPQRFTLQR